ncbi:MAG: hypothetical protein HYX78_03755 [Armatimonadetes bacterium]|nr:hypothetical protein [Armatimonadota bacterium]
MAAAAAIGLAYNELRADKLPLIRAPLRETRRVAKLEQLMPSVPPVTESQESDDMKEEPSLGPAQEEPPKAEKTGKPVAAKLEPKAETARRIAGDQERPVSSAETPADRKAVEEKPLKEPENTDQNVQALFTTLEDAKACFDSKTALFVDARPAEDYQAEHVPGAVSLYSEKLSELYDAVLGATPKDKLLVTYCSDPECSAAVELADQLVARGHTRVVILLEGLPGWKSAGYPTVSGKASPK